MSWRAQAVEAIRRWNKLELSQKSLAARAKVHPSVIPHIRDYPEYAVSEATAERIVAVVDAQECSRIDALEMEVVAYCHAQEYVPTDVEGTQMVAELKRTLGRPNSSDSIHLPEGVNGALIRVHDTGARIYVVLLAPGEADDQRRALAHELAHLRSLILKKVEPSTTNPKSAF